MQRRDREHAGAEGVEGGLENRVVHATKRVASVTEARVRSRLTPVFTPHDAERFKNGFAIASLSLAPGFSRVLRSARRRSRFNGFGNGERATEVRENR